MVVIFRLAMPWKVTTETGVNRGYQLHEGLNTESDFNPDPDAECTRGLYFCERKVDVLSWAGYLNYDWVYDVKIPEDARVVRFPTKARADQLVLSNKRSMKDFAAALGPADCLSIVRHYSHLVEYLTAEQRTPAICLAAVQQCGWAVQLLTEEQRTPEVCLAAVQQESRVLTYCLSAKQQAAAGFYRFS